MQFTSRFLLLITAAFALLFALLFALPSFFAGAITFFLLGAVPASLSCGIYFGSDKAKAFCVGALIPIFPNTIFCYFISSPAIVVAEEIDWWQPREQAPRAEEAFTTMYRTWDHIGYSLLAMQIPIWVTAIACGVCALMASNWFMARRGLQEKE